MRTFALYTAKGGTGKSAAAANLATAFAAETGAPRSAQDRCHHFGAGPSMRSRSIVRGARRRIQPDGSRWVLVGVVQIHRGGSGQRHKPERRRCGQRYAGQWQGGAPPRRFVFGSFRLPPWIPQRVSPGTTVFRHWQPSRRMNVHSRRASSPYGPVTASLPIPHPNGPRSEGRQGHVVAGGACWPRRLRSLRA